MKWSWKLGTVAGIGLYVHATFLILIAWVALSHWQEGHSPAATLAGVAFILGLFGFVVLHELGHALTARHYGIRTRDITLLPIGGVARLERMPDDPREELWVALAGPAVNGVIAVALFLLLQEPGGLTALVYTNVAEGPVLQRFMLVNMFLAAFNLIPAFPMDGGRVLRALLATRMDYVQATQKAAHLGQGIALLFGLIGVFGNPFLLFIALFVWIGAAQEASVVQMKSALGGIPVGRAMLTDFHALAPDDSLARAVDLTLAGSQQDFPVVDNGRIAGVLTRADLLGALARKGLEARVEEVMRRQFQVIDSAEMLEAALGRLQESNERILPVMRMGRLVGLVTMENVGEFLAIHAALGAAHRKS